MLRFGSLLLLTALVVSAASCATNEQMEPTEPKGECSFTLPTDFSTMTREAYESWLRLTPLTLSTCERELTAEEIERALSTFDQAQADIRRWREASHHWDILDEFDNHMAKIQGDRVVDAAEASFICDVAPQWAAQMEAALSYVSEYREHDPTLVEETPRLHKLETDAARKAATIAEFTASCP